VDNYWIQEKELSFEAEGYRIQQEGLPLSYSAEFMILFRTHMNAIFHVLQELNFNSMAVDAPTYWSFSSVHNTNMAVV
jgi:hypothetical protein